MTDFDELVGAIRGCSDEQKQKIFSEIRDAVIVHELERLFNVRAEVILEAIRRASDLTQRGVRGVIAETVFALEVIPTLSDWNDDPPVGDLSYDCCLCSDQCRVRIQVKLQRRQKGKPKKGRDGLYVVEVQRTRSGKKSGVKTRPYRFGDFDLLAVCMEPSTGEWTSFMYASASDLKAKPGDATIIKTMQSVPAWTGQHPDFWTSSLAAALERFQG